MENKRKQKQPLRIIMQKSCSGKFCMIHRKTPAPRLHFNKLKGYILFLQNIYEREPLGELVNTSFNANRDHSIRRYAKFSGKLTFRKKC